MCLAWKKYRLFELLVQKEYCLSELMVEERLFLKLDTVGNASRRSSFNTIPSKISAGRVVDRISMADSLPNHALNGACWRQEW